MGSRKKRHEARKRAPQKQHHDLQQRAAAAAQKDLARLGIQQKGPLQIDGAGVPKASAALEKIVEPFRDAEGGVEVARKLYMLGAAAWNAALFPKEQWDEKIEKAMVDLPAEGKGVIVPVLKAMMVRKDLLYPKDRRAILSVQVTDLGNTYYLSVTTMPTESKAGQD